MKQLCSNTGCVTGDEARQRPLANLSQKLGEAFVAAVADPATIGMLLGADGTLWQERLRGQELWRPIETMAAARAEEMLSTVAAITSDRTLKVEVRLDGTRVVGEPFGLNCVCCRPRPLQAAPDPLFRLCWRKMYMIRTCLKNIEREELRALNNKNHSL